jgi:hypothetical protein
MLMNIIVIILLFLGGSSLFAFLPWLVDLIPHIKSEPYFINEIFGILIIPAYLAIITNLYRSWNISNIVVPNVILVAISIISIVNAIIIIFVDYQGLWDFLIGIDNISKIIAAIIISLSIAVYFVLYFVIEKIFFR